MREEVRAGEQGWRPKPTGLAIGRPPGQRIGYVVLAAEKSIKATHTTKERLL